MNLLLWYKVRTDSTSAWTEKWGAGQIPPTNIFEENLKTIPLFAIGLRAQ